ncbi:MAG: hypothetical protein ABI618_17580 [Nitrospirota bacterium]
MNGQTTGTITRHIRRMCVVEGDSAWAEDDVPPERRYEETKSVGERRERRVGIIRWICCNGLPSSLDWGKRMEHILVIVDIYHEPLVPSGRIGGSVNNIV